MLCTFKVNCKLLLALSVLIFSNGCESEDDPSIEDYWELEQLVINNADTTAFVRNDSNCFGYVHFYVREETGERVITHVPYYNAATFNCMERGYYFQSGKILKMDYLSNPPNIGPYLSSEEVTWTVLELSQNRLRLETNYQNAPCYLTFKRRQ